MSNVAIIFDMDGTLFQTNLILERVLEATFAQLRADSMWSGSTPLAQYRKIMGVPLPVVWQTLCPCHRAAQREKSNALFQEALIAQIKQGHGALYEEVEQTLMTLAKKYPLFIASNGQTAYLQAIVDTYKLAASITATYSIDTIASGNKSELVATIMKTHRIEKGFVVGDRLSDICAASDNQLQSIGVRFDFSQQEELVQANFIVDRFSAIIAIVEKSLSSR